MNTKRILAVDDEATNLKLVKKLLVQAGYECLCEPDGNSALEAVRELQPDLMLVDVMMPGMDGFELVQHLKGNESTRHIPVIFLTSLSDRESRLKGLDSGAEEFVSKPLDKQELLLRVRNLLRFQEVSQELEKQKMTFETRLQLRSEDLYDTRMDTIRSLCRAIEFRENPDSLHVIRVSEISQLIAEQIGLSENQCELILNASPMHDIGMCVIPDSILLKPEKLTELERARVQTHTHVGYDLLNAQQPSQLINMAKSIALNHHEKWDGSGYPAGLSGETIPVEARVVALADVFGALIADRPYRKAFGKDEAVAMVSEQKGVHFQPLIVEAFLELLPEVDNILELHGNDAIQSEVSQEGT